MTRILLHLYDYFTSRRTVLMTILAGLVVLLGFLAQSIHFQEDITRFFPETDSPRSVNLIFDHLKVKDKIAVMITAPEDMAEPSREDMAALCDRMVSELLSGPDSGLIREATWRIGQDRIVDAARYVYRHLPVLIHPSAYPRIESLLNADSLDHLLQQHYTMLTSPQGSLAREFIALDPLGIGTPVLDSMVSMLLNDNSLELYGEHLYSRDGRTLIWFLTPVYPAGNSSENNSLIRSMEHCIAQYRSEGNPYLVEFTGGPTFSVYNARQVKKDTAVTLGVALMIIIMGILLLYRDVRTIPLIILPTCFGSLFALAGIYLIQGSISFISVSAGVVVLGMAMSYSIHVLTHFLECLSARSVVMHLSRPLALGGLTTIGAFLSLLFTESEILNDLGLFAALTLVGATLFCLIFLPHLLPKSMTPAGGLIWKRLERFNKGSFETSPWVIGLLVLLLTGGFIYSGRVRFNTDMMQLHYNHPSYTAADQRFYRLTQKDGEVVYMVNASRDLTEALSGFRRVKDQLQHFAGSGQIASVTHAGLFLLTPEEQRNRIRLWNEFWTPERISRLEILLAERSKANRFNPEAFRPFLDQLEQPATPIDLSHPDPMAGWLLDDWLVQQDSFTFIASRMRIQERHKSAVYPQLDQEPTLVVFDIPHLSRSFISVIRDDFNTVLYLCSVIVFVALWISCGRLEITLMTFLPMACSWVIILGVMGAFNLEFNILNIIISTFIFGLGDDFSIFIMDGLLVDYRSGKHTLAGHKTAIIFSAFATLVGLGALVFAQHPGLRSISIISIIGILSVVWIAYTLQPLLFRFFVSGRALRGEFPHTLKSLAQSIHVYIIFLSGCVVLSLGSVLLRVLWFVDKYFFHWVMMYWSRLVVFSVPHMKNRILNPYGEDFRKPAILIANHQSFIDSLAVCMLYPKVVVFVNSWTWNSPFFGLAIRYADFFYIGQGVEYSREKLEPLVRKGYSIVIFPEGTRSATGKIGRFHKGAFLLSQEMKLDIIPISLVGFNEVMSKTDGFYLKDGGLTVHIGKRIPYDDPSWGTTFQERCRSISAFYKRSFAVLQHESQDTWNPYYRFKLQQTYAYKGTQVERALRRELRTEYGYGPYHHLIPRNAVICELGCGYGFLAHMLAYLARDRQITAVDDRPGHIELASTGFDKDIRLRFVSCELPRFELPECDVIILSHPDMSLSPREQAALTQKCFQRLPEGGILLIRHNEKSGPCTEPKIGVSVPADEWPQPTQLIPGATQIIPEEPVHTFTAYRKNPQTC